MSPENQPPKTLVPAIESKPSNSDEVTFVRPTKPMTVREVLAEMDKQGLRPVTLEGMKELIPEPNVIEPKDTDIILDKNDVKRID
jgi:hypothetical protein